MDMWDIWFESWITMDWDYNDIAVGDVIESRISFVADAMQPTEEQHERVVRLHDRPRCYSVVGSVVEVWMDSGWVIDFGLRASTRNPIPNGVARYDYVAGEIDLFIDYPEADVGGQRPRWCIEAITRCICPLLFTYDEHGALTSRTLDLPNARRESAIHTDHDDAANVIYLLRCRKLDADPDTILTET